MQDIIELPVKDFTFTCRVAGDNSHSPVILLHGFPETSYMWKSLMDSLVQQKYFCIAPNLRGYSKGACPKGVANYKVTLLAQDVIDVADAMGIKKFHLIGHDWGSAIGWHTAFNFPERVLSWTAMSVPHPRAFAKAFKSDPIQKKKSRYIGMFLLPWIPEFIIRRNNFSRLKKVWKRSSSEEIDDYLSVFRIKGSLTAALNYYRANLGKGKGVPVDSIRVPTLFIWGNKDVAVGEIAAKGNPKYIDAPYTFVEVEGGHWLVQTNFDQVESSILAHLKETNLV